MAVDGLEDRNGRQTSEVVSHLKIVLKFHNGKIIKTNNETTINLRYEETRPKTTEQDKQ